MALIQSGEQKTAQCPCHAQWIRSHRLLQFQSNWTTAVKHPQSYYHHFYNECHDTIHSQDNFTEIHKSLNVSSSTGPQRNMATFTYDTLLSMRETTTVTWQHHSFLHSPMIKQHSDSNTVAARFVHQTYSWQISISTQDYCYISELHLPGPSSVCVTISP